MKLDLDTTPARIASTFAELSDEAERIARGESALDEFVQGLSFVAAATASGRNVREMADLRGRFARLVDRLEGNRAGDGVRRLDIVVNFLRGLMALLEQTETAARIEIQSRQRDLAVKRLRERLLEELSSRARARPRDLVAVLGVAPAQVSRALRDLEADRLITSATPPLFGDRRARWYQAVTGSDDSVTEANQTRQKAAPPNHYAPRSVAHEVLARIDCMTGLTSDDLVALVVGAGDEAGTADLQLTLDSLIALEFVQKSGSSYHLTPQGERELVAVLERGFVDTLDDLLARVPADFRGAVALVGAPGSGKREVGRELARRRGWPHLSVGTFIRTYAPDGTTESQLKEFADHIISDLGWLEFLRRAITATGIVVGEGAIVIDGSSPYPDGLRALRELYPSVIPVFLDAPDWMRALRHKQEREVGFDPESAPAEVESTGFAPPAEFDRLAVQGTVVPNKRCASAT
jgi:cytidylate kinase/DNA-binding MarR family transcriptional regulator